MIVQVSGDCPVCMESCVAAQTVGDGHRHDFSSGVTMCFTNHSRPKRDGPLVMYIHDMEDES